MNGSRRSFLKASGAIGAIAAIGGFPRLNWVPRVFADSMNPPKMDAKENITVEISRWAAGVKFDDLSGDAVHQAKRFLLDAMGCALGGYRQPDTAIALQVLDEIAAPGPATVIGSGKKIDCVHAAFVNALMIRCMDYNDIYWKQDPAHPSDIFPAAIACGERARSDGRELIVGLVLGHEFNMRFVECAFPGIRERGWHHATLTAFVSPIVAGRMLHLPWQQIQQAIGISASARATFGAVTAGKLTMMKNTADPLATESRCARRLAGVQGLYRARACDRWQRGTRSGYRRRVEAQRADRRLGQIVAHHPVRHEVFPHRSADPDPHLGRARSGQGERPQA